MAVQVHTNDSAALTDADLDELASMGGSFGIGELSKAKEDWVLITVARIDGKLHGFTFSTLERIGGTPCVLIGLMSVKRTSKRDQVLRGLMGEAYHRALMAFPDEDVVVGSRFVSPGALDAFKELDDVTPSPGYGPSARSGLGPSAGQAVRRRGQIRREDVHGEADGQDGYIDHDVLKPEAVAAARQELFRSAGRHGRLADRLRLDDGRGPRQARRDAGGPASGRHVGAAADARVRRRRPRAGA